jgi:hypothetical protein
MSDSNNKNDSLERFFQKKAGEYDISYNEGDWLKLESRLDNLDKQFWARKRRRLVAAAVLLLLSVLGYFTIENHLRINKLNEKLSSDQIIQQEQPGDKPTGNGIKPQSDAASQGNKNLKVNEKKSTKNIAKAPPVGEHQAKNPVLAEENNTAIKEPIQQFSDYILPEQTVDATQLSPDIVTAHITISDIIPAKNKISSNALATASHNEPAAFVDTRDKSTSRKFTRASFGLVMGPDLSTAGSISNFYDPGYKFGLSFDYYLNPDFGINIGLERAKVRYAASGNDYRPPQGYWANGVIPYKTVGNCVLLDIPINLKYKFLHFKHSRIYATAGLSSYIMLDERYRFKYNGYQQGQAREWSGKTGTRHWFSNASFSIGYEFDLFNNWSLRA